MNYIDIEKNNPDGGYYYNNTPSQFAKTFNVFDGDREAYAKQMQLNLETFNKSIDYSGIEVTQNYNKNFSEYNPQRGQWAKLKSFIDNKQGRIMAFDRETIGDVSGYGTNNSGITEIGITDTILGKNISNDSYSIAFGVNNKQIDEALKLFKQVEEKGYDGLTSSELSTIERYSRYSGRITDVFGQRKIKGIGDNVTIVKGLAESKIYDINAAYSGLVNLAVVGGSENSSLQNLFSLANKKDLYDSSKKIFMDAGLSSQNKESDVFKKAISKIVMTSYDKNAILTGFNINGFDNAIINAAAGTQYVKLNKENVIDVFYGALMASKGNGAVQTSIIAEQHGLSNTTFERMRSQEAMAKAIGVEFPDMAHNAASDTYVTNQIVLSDNFINGKSLMEAAEDSLNTTSGKYINSLLQSFNVTGENRPVLFALNSILFNKNGMDSLRDGNDNFLSKYSDFGVNRGRYYNINSIKDLNGKYGVEFETAGALLSKTDTRKFIKVFDSKEELLYSLQKNFSFENPIGSSLTNLPSVSPENIRAQELNYFDDTARRNYEDMFNTRSIELDIKSNKYVGGYEKLNQYYKAYDEVAEKINKYFITDEDIKFVRDGKYRDEVVSALKNNGLYFDGANIDDIQMADGQSNLRNFEALFGKLHDEQEVFNYIDSQLADKNLNNYQKTYYAKSMREKIISDIVKENADKETGLSNFKKESTSKEIHYYRANRQDLYNVELYTGGKEPLNVNFENIENATQTMYNGFKKAAENATDKNTAMVSSMLNALNILHENDIFDDDYIKHVTEAFSGTASTQNAWNLANEIATGIHTHYVQPLQEKGYSIDMLKNVTFNKIDNPDLVSFIKSKSELLGEDVKTKIRTRFNAKDNEIRSLSDIFNVYKQGKSLQNISNQYLAEASNMRFSLHSNMDDIKTILKDKLNYNEENVSYIDRMLNLTKEKGKSSYGLTTYQSEKGKTDFVTQFYHSGEDGSNAFILVNKTSDKDARDKIMGIMSKNISNEEKINAIKEGNLAAVFELPAIHENEDMLKDLDNMSKGQVYRTIGQGYSGYEKIVQEQLNVYTRNEGKKLSDVEISITDNVNEMLKAFTITHDQLIEDLQKGREGYASATARYKKITDREFAKMPGPSGIEAIPIFNEDGSIKEWNKVILPNFADMMQSSKINIDPLQDVVIRAAMETNDLDMMKLLHKFSDDYDGTEYGGPGAMEALHDKLLRNKNISPEFNEYFYKHFAIGDFSNELNYTTNMKGSFLSYLYNKAKENPDLFNEKTRNTIMKFWSNKDRISQIVKEHDASKMLVSQMDGLLLNHLSTLDSSNRPTIVQQLTARHYVKDIVANELGAGTEIDRLNKFGLTLGYDAMPIQKEQILKNVEDSYGKYETVVTGHVKQIDTTDLMNEYNEFQKSLSKNKTISELAQSISQYGINTADFDMGKLNAAFALFKKEMNNTYESKGFIRPSIANTTMFTAPDLKKVEINELSDYELINPKNDYIENLKKEKVINSGDVIGQVKNGEEKVDVVYHGPSGKIIGDVEEFLKKGKGFVKEFEEGIHDNKVFIANEKMTMRILEYMKNDRKFSAFANKDEFNAYTDIIMDRIFGHNVMSVTNMEIGKHSSGSVIYGNYLNEIFRAFNKAVGDEKDFKGVEKRFNDLLFQSGKGLHTGFDEIIGLDNDDRLKNPLRHFTYNQELIGNAGIHTQIENMLDIIKSNATKDKKGFWGNLWSNIENNQKNNTALLTMSRQIMGETMGDTVYLDGRMALNMRTQFMEDLDGYDTKLNKSLGDIIVDDIINESLNDNVKDASVKNFGMKYRSAEDTVKGMHFSLSHMPDSDNISDMANMLEINLEDIVTAPSGSSREEISNHFIKEVDGKKVIYSDLIKKKAAEKGITGDDLSSINAVKINLNNGIKYNLETMDENGKLITKELKSIIMPIMDVTAYKGDVYYSKTEILMNNFLRIAKEYGDGPVKDSKEALSDAANKLFINLGNELSGVKKSYLNSKIMKLPMKNSAMFFAQSSIAPVVGDMIKNKNEWLTNADYRERLIKAIKDGDTSEFDIDLYTSKLRNAKYTKKAKGKLLYENITELSREGFERMGVDFKEIGADIYFNRKDFKYIQKVDVSLLAKHITDPNVLKALEDEQEFKRLLKVNNTLMNAEKAWARMGSEWVDRKRAEIEALAHIGPDTIQDFKQLRENMIHLAETYIEDEGIMGMVVRYPTFHEGSIRATKYRLNNNLGRNEIITTSAQGDRLKLDFDGDNLFAKLFMDNNKLMRKGSRKYKTIEKWYNKQIAGNNEVMADLLQSQSDHIRDYGVPYDLVSDIDGNVKNYAYKKQLLDTLVTNDDLEEIASNNGIKFTSIKDLTEKETDMMFKEWDKKMGNLLKNPFVQLSAIKARITKGEVGYFSNVNYLLNQSIYTAIDKAYKEGNTQLAEELQAIKKDLHSQNKGLLYETEQKGIDVKHAKEGLNIAESPDWMRGMKNLIGENNELKQRKAISTMLNAVTGKIKGFESNANKAGILDAIFDPKANLEIFTEKEQSVIKQFRSLYSLSKNKTVRDMFNSKVGKTIESVKQLNTFRANLELLEESAGSIEGTLSNIIKDEVDFLRFGFTDTNDVFHRIAKDAVYIGLSDNEGLRIASGYMLNSFKIKRNGTVKAVFDKVNLNSLKISKKELTFTGSIKEVNAKLQDTFGGHQEYSIAELRRNLDLKYDIRTQTAIANTQAYADMLARNVNADEATIKKLKNNFLNKNLPATEHSDDIVVSKRMISNYNKKVDMDYFIDFRDKIRYIKSKGKDFYKEDININTAYEDHITAINKQIIEDGLQKNTSTSIESIFDEHIKQIAKNVGVFNSTLFDAFKAKQTLVNEEVFDSLAGMVDISKATKTLNDAVNVRDLDASIRNTLNSQTEKIIGRYKGNNLDKIKEVQNSILHSIDTVTELDNLFGWNSKDMANMRVGIGEHFGRRFGELSKDEIQSILKYQLNSQNAFALHSEKQTKAYLNSFKASKKIGSLSSSLSGANYEDIASLTETMNKMRLEMGEAPVKTAINEAEKAASETAATTMKKKMTNSIFDTVKEMKNSTAGKVALGLAALGIASNLLNTGTQSPLSPEMKPNGTSPGVNGYSERGSVAPKSPNKKVLYTDNKSGLQYKMTAKSRQKLSQMDTAQMLSNQTGGNTDVNVYDDRSQVSNNWLERKFSEIV